MQLYQYAQKNASRSIRFFPFTQSEGQCFVLSNFWLRWFLSSSQDEILQGNFNAYPAHPILNASVHNTALPDCLTHGYMYEINNILDPYSLKLSTPCFKNYYNLLDCINIDRIDWSNQGGLIFANKSPSSEEGIGHVLCFGVRRFPEQPDTAIFAFFDANQGTFLMVLEDFPATRTGLRSELDIMNDTRHVLPNDTAHQCGLDKISNFINDIQYEYDYQKYHCEKIKLKKGAPFNQGKPRSPGSTSPVIHSAKFSPNNKSPRSLSQTIPTQSSIRK